MDVVNNKSYKKFLIVWMGQMISSIGVGLTAFSLGVYAFEKTNTATSAALITLFSFLPSILLRPVGGVLADRYDRRVMMILGDLGSALGLVFILFVMLTGDVQLWQIYVGVTISSIFAALQSPAYKASATDLLTDEQFSKGSGLVQLAESAKFLFSPIIAGFLLSVTTIENILIIDISTFVVAILAVLFVKKNLQTVSKESENQNFLTDLKEGWNAISSSKGILLLVTIISIVTFYLGFLQTLIGPMILSFSDARTLGTFQSVSAIGMIISSLVIGIFSVSKKYSRMLVLGMVFAGLSFSLLGLTTNLYFIIGAGFLFLSALPFINTSADVLVRQNISNEKQGRVWGIIGILSQLGFVVAYSLAGFLADHVFNPLLEEGGLLAPSIGEIIGTGPGRGIGLLFIIAGVLVMILAGITSRFESIKSLENSSRLTQSEQEVQG
ncbi:MFS transporter [Paenibacillus wynnii]|uniref:Macrolide transporter n=1 Tax=Paenibacillus wynnii TaxID=268407 RepID=A0A098M2A7_9BACL|nr:MFS transporter [Paenibacillus wynnii]KGE16350.1 macrolide transporter [Paenibacillus wynnii]